MTVVKHRSYKKFSGPMIRGTYAQYTPSMHDSHFTRALWLTSMVESGGKYGAITMYDGTGVTAGLHQAVAVYPRALSEQGPLFKLLRRLDCAIPIYYYKLGVLIDEQRWIIAEDGVLRKENGEMVPPRAFRDIVTPVGGKTPRSGDQWEQAKRWALAFHELFTLPGSLKTQEEYGREHFVKKCKRLKHVKLGYSTIEDLVYDGECLNPDVFKDYPWLDLAMSVFWSHSVNGPAPALTRLARALKSHPDVHDPKFAKRLVRQLANAKYGRWTDDIPSGRWQRTRNEAMKVWPDDLFNGPDAVMTKKM